VSKVLFQIPENWSWTTMGEISDVIGGGTPKTKIPANYQNGTIPWLTPADLSGYTEKFVGSGSRYITEVGLSSSSARMMPAGTVLFTSRAPIGYVAIASNDICTNQGFKSFVLKSKEILPEYVYWWLKGNKELAESYASGTTFLELSGSKAKQLPIPIAPPRQQERIVAEIEKQFSRLDEAVANLKRVKANLKRYKAAVLKAAVEGKLTEGTWKPLASAVESIDQGWSPRCDREASGSNGRWGVIKTTAVQAQYYLEVENKALPDALEPRPGLEIKSGDLLITRAGPRGRVGVCCLVRKTRPKLMMCDKVYRLRCKLDIVTPEYLELVLNAPQIIELLDELKTGISDSGVNLTQGRFVAMKLPLPSIPIQQAIVDETERRISILSELEREFSTDLCRTDRLRQSILKQAFSGQLVPQNGNDEPASVLLERIRATQPAQPKQPTVSQRKRRAPGPKPGAPSTEPLPMVAETTASYGDAIAARILAVMQPGREYVRADLAEPLGLTTGQWNAAIQELKRGGKVRQVGERRGARYRRQ